MIPRTSTSLTPRKILSLHPPLGDRTIDGLLTAIEPELRRLGAGRIWVETHAYPDLTIMAMMPELAAEPVGVPA